MTTIPNTVHTRVAEQSLTFSRAFAAPPESVFRAHVEAELFSRWVGPRGTEMRMRHFDARTGGGWSYVITAGGGEWAFFGSYHEVVPSTRIVHTWEFEGEPGLPTLEILTFVDLGGGRSRIDGLSVYTTPQHCAAMLASDESGNGMDENFERLDELLVTLGG